MIAYVPSLDLYLDSTAPYAPFGLLLAGEYDKPVVLADARAPRLGRTPAMPESGIALTTRTEGRISADGVVSGRTTTIATGPQSIALRAMAAWFEGRGTAYAASTQLQLLGTPGTGRYAFDSPDNGDGVYQVAGEFVLDEPLAEGGAEPFSVPGGLGAFGRPGKLLLNAGFTEDGGHACYPGREVEEITLELPSGMTLQTMPQDVSVQAGGASYSAQYAMTDGALTIRREFRVTTSHQLCRTPEFEAMRGVLNAGRREQQRQVSLVRDQQRLAGAP